MRRTLSGSRNYGAPSGAKWGWITRQQPVPPYYPPGLPHLYPLQTSPPWPLCSTRGHTTSHTTMTPSPALSGWMEARPGGEGLQGGTGTQRGGSSLGGLRNHCAYFTGAPCHWSSQSTGNYRREWRSGSRQVKRYSPFLKQVDQQSDHSASGSDFLQLWAVFSSFS